MEIVEIKLKSRKDIQKYLQRYASNDYIMQMSIRNKPTNSFDSIFEINDFLYHINIIKKSDTHTKKPFTLVEFITTNKFTYYEIAEMLNIKIKTPPMNIDKFISGIITRSDKINNLLN